MLKMAEERSEIVFQKKVLANDKDKWIAIEKIKDTYRDKLETRLNTEVESIKTMYGQILERLPTITGKLHTKI